MFLLSQEGGERLALVFLDIIEHRRHKVSEQVESWRVEKMEMLLLVICRVFPDPFCACITSLHICYVCIIYNPLYTYDTCDISTCIYKYDHSHMHVYNCTHIVFKVMTWICHILISTCICMDTRARTHTQTHWINVQCSLSLTIVCYQRIFKCWRVSWLFIVLLRNRSVYVCDSCSK